MAKISKRLLNKHNEALKLLEKDHLDYDDREFIYDNYHEGAGKMNNLISAHFTPNSIALSMTHCIRHNNWVDIGAGIGKLSYKNYRMLTAGGNNDFFGICVENCTEYYEVGKKLLPEMIWINGSIFDQDVINEIKMLMNSHGEHFSILSNPPYGKQVKGSNPLMHYTGSIFEYKAIEIGAILGASDGAFLIPQVSCPFRLTNINGRVYDDEYKTSAYNKFVKETDLHIAPNMGYSTNTDDEDTWKDVSITTEIAIVEYEEENYKPKEELTQTSLF